MIRIAIVEDDDNERNQLRRCIDRYAKEHGEEFSIVSFSDGLSFLDNYKPVYDIIFMDINMPYENGISVAKRLRMFDGDVCLIFVTQMAQYAISAYDVSAKDYLLKPILYASFAFRFERTLAAVRSAMAGHRYIVVKTQKGIVRLDAGSIYYIEVIKHTVIYHTTGGTIEAWASLKNVEDSMGDLAGKQFVRCNNCFLVNLQFVERIEDDVVIVGGAELKISRARRRDFLNSFTLYCAEGG